jgi:hypothetical protein
MFLMPVCFCSSPSFKFYSLVSSGGEFQMFSPAAGAPATPPPAGLYWHRTTVCTLLQWYTIFPNEGKSFGLITVTAFVIDIVLQKPL